MSELRREQIEQTLRQEFSPEELEVVDESHLHAGHAGAKSGGGHFRVRIVSERFEGRGRVERHRMVYAALQSAFEGDIHALSVEARALGE